ncbi:sensor histidine kinase [Lacisediminihabitans changchengi]|uniref:histidine kinase n=1 Tax=Lacisediminihabitans changchengi TaxID=2787634 RepID=A0A934W169_9MICO|nr:HAMP domain-containing sensor histidine kinase [Lacisediminihabitans changchengi]MBK4346563.1 HAMP domain-containing histidine kinase [Lacisediminihabitans changchengi]
MRRITVPVRVRILAVILVVTALGMAVAGGTSFLLQRERVLSQVDTRLTDTASRLRSIATGTDFATVRDLLGAAIQQITPDTNEGILGIVDGRAAVIPGSEVGLSLEKDTALIDRVNRETTKGRVVIGTTITDQGALRYIAVPVSAAGDSATGLYVAAFSIDAELAPIAEASATFALVSLGALIVVAIVGWFVAGRLLRPLRVLRETAERITATDLDERIPLSGHDDVSELTRTVNAMLDRMQHAIVGQRRLLDDVGHELRTPLTIVRGHLELLDAVDAEQVRATRDLTLDEVDRMRGLVADIALLARATRDTAVDIAPTDVASLTESVYAKVSALDGARDGRSWSLTETAEAVAGLDADSITQAWLQLASNADRYATPGTRVELGSRVSGDSLLLWVRDVGPGIPSEAHGRIFERFRRGTAQQRGRGETGSGLGLAIVAAIARAHGGTVLLDSAPGVGSTFTLVLPISEGRP